MTLYYRAFDFSLPLEQATEAKQFGFFLGGYWIDRAVVALPGLKLRAGFLFPVESSRDEYDAKIKDMKEIPA